MSSKNIEYIKHHFADCSVCGHPICAGEEYVDISFNKCRVIKVENEHHGCNYETEVTYAETLLAICRSCEGSVDCKNIRMKPRS